jgi:hypothetical protein
MRTRYLSLRFRRVPVYLLRGSFFLHDHNTYFDDVAPLRSTPHIQQRETELGTMTTTEGFSYDSYMQYLDQLGESILQWADPNHDFRGFTSVCCRLVSLLWIGLP